MLSQRIYGLALGYEDLNYHEQLRSDPLMAVLSGKRELDEPLAGKSTLNRLELAGRSLRYHKIGYSTEAIHRLPVDLYIESHAAPPAEIVLDLDATDIPVYGHQPERFFHGYYDSYCYLPLYIFAGHEGLLDEPRPGTSRKLSGKQVESVLARTLESQPEAATHWSTRDMAKACGLSQSSVSRIWRAFSLAPHRSETFSFLAIRCSSRRCATSSVCILTLPTARWCYAWTRSRRYRLWTEPLPCCLCAQGRSNAARMTMRVTAQPVCLPPSIPSPGN